MLTLYHNYFHVPPNLKNGKENNKPFQKRRFILGLCVLLIVDVLWVASSELTKYIYAEKSLERPFLITYVRSCLLLVYLLVLCFTPYSRDPVRSSVDYTQLLEPNTETEDENFFNDGSNNLGDSTFVPVRAGETTDSDDAAPRAVRFNKVAEVRVMSAAQAGEALLARLSWSASERASQHAQRRAAAAATRRHVRLAFTFCLPWFMANYLYRVSLLNTSTSTATVYTSTASAFALSFGAIFAQIPTDRLTLTKCIAVLLTAVGIVGVGIFAHNWTSVLSSLGAALCYAVHLLMLRQELRNGENINSPLLVGLMGSASAGIMWVLGGVLTATGAEPADLPTAKSWSWMFIDAAFGPLLLETLWSWGQALTSTRTATGALALTIPLALGAEAWRGAGGAGGAGGAEAATAAAALLAAAGWLLAAGGDCSCALLLPSAALFRLTNQRNVPDLDEQSEALISSEEPT